MVYLDRWFRRCFRSLYPEHCVKKEDLHLNHMVKVSNKTFSLTNFQEMAVSLTFMYA